MWLRADYMATAEYVIIGRLYGYERIIGEWTGVGRKIISL